MTLWAIVPVKPLRRAKSRLAGVLNEEERAALSQEMLLHTLRVLGDVKPIERVLVVSRDSHALALARAQGARTITEQGSPHLNEALVRATMLAKAYGVSAILILPADLPLMTGEDIERIIARAIDPPVVVIAPDRRRRGTNALLTAPAGIIEYDFGPDSFESHQARGREAGARLEICELPSVELDLDLPEDLEALRLQIQRATSIVDEE
jgi:2-phospho-L-lactate guanylyltransferase